MANSRKVGLTRDIEKAKKHWKAKHPKSFRNWQIVANFPVLSGAASYLKMVARDWDSEALPYVDGLSEEPREGIWYIYFFEHGKD